MAKRPITSPVARANHEAAMRDWQKARERALLARRKDLVEKYEFDPKQTTWTEIDGRREAMLRELEAER